MRKKMKVAAMIAVSAAVCQVSLANLVVNGDFEADPFDSAWTHEKGTATQVAGLGGTDSAAYTGSGVWIEQAFSATGLSTCQVDFMWNMDTMDGNQRFRLYGDAVNPVITLRMTATGLDKYTNGSGWWTTVAGTYTAGTTYHIRVNVGNYDADAYPEYIMGVSTDGVNYSFSGPMSGFHEGVDVFYPLKTVQFEGSYATGGGMTVDQVSVIPEPATLGLVVAFGGGILFVRRKMAM